MKLQLAIFALAATAAFGVNVDVSSQTLAAVGKKGCGDYEGIENPTEIIRGAFKKVLKLGKAIAKKASEAEHKANEERVPEPEDMANFKGELLPPPDKTKEGKLASTR